MEAWDREKGKAITYMAGEGAILIGGRRCGRIAGWTLAAVEKGGGAGWCIVAKMVRVQILCV
jgi:hypothetical protein